MTQKQKQMNSRPVRHALYGGIVKKENKSLLGLLNRILVLLIIIAGVYSIACINDLAVKGFVIKELKTELSELTRKNEANELAVMRLESYENISKRAFELKMVKADKIEYIGSSGGAVAKK